MRRTTGIAGNRLFMAIVSDYQRKGTTRSPLPPRTTRAVLDATQASYTRHGRFLRFAAASPTARPAAATASNVVDFTMTAGCMSNTFCAYLFLNDMPVCVCGGVTCCYKRGCADTLARKTMFSPQRILVRFILPSICTKTGRTEVLRAREPSHPARAPIARRRRFRPSARPESRRPCRRLSRRR